jgi:hypothetical protein
MRRIVWAAAVVFSVFTSVNAKAAIQIEGRAAPVDRITPLLDQSANGVYHVHHVAKPPVIDGNPDEWKDVPAMSLDKKGQSGGAWAGPSDLSGAMRVVWDERALYFCVQVKDDVHHAPNADEYFWDNDGCQFVFDAYMNGPAGPYDLDELSFFVSDSPKGPLMARYRARGVPVKKEELLAKQAVKTSVQADGTRVYEWALPWDVLEPISPWILGRCGFGFTLNDNDGKGFKGGLFWTPGILWGQDASKLGQLIFDDAVGSRDAILPLRAESRFFDQPGSQWLGVEKTDPFFTARLLVRTRQKTPVQAKLQVFREGKDTPVAVGVVDHETAAGTTTVFTWDLRGLATGRYELQYEVPGVTPQPSPRLMYHHVNAEQIWARRDELRRQYGIDRPWDDMADAPARIRRHRGLVAAALRWLDRDSPLRYASGFNGGYEDIAGGQWRAMEEAVRIITALDEGKDHLAAQRNQFWCGILSRADGEGQPFVVSVPANFKPGRTYPLVVTLHGAGGMQTPDRTLVHKDQYIEVFPAGRGNTSYCGLGESDVLEVIAYMREWYRIDPDLIYLTGGSMGGAGTWRIASRHPDLFAAAAPRYGWAEGAPLENLRNVPVLNQHGAMDILVAIDGSRYAVSRLQKMGYAVAYKESPEGGHDMLLPCPSLEWMLARTRVERPAAVTYTCDTTRCGRAYWTEVLHFTEPHGTARVDACVNGSGPYQTVTLQLANIDALQLHVAEMPVDRDADLIVQAGYDMIEVQKPLPANLFIVRQQDAWAVAREWNPPQSEVRPYQPGAAAGLYTGEPLLIVYGTKGGKDCTEQLKQVAKLLAVWPGSGGRAVFAAFPVKGDGEVTDEDLARYNLVLLGSRRQNSIVARLADKLPFTINDKNHLLAGGREPVSLDGAGIRLAYYNPLAPQRLIFLVATDEPGENARKWLANGGALLTGSGGWERGDQPDLVVQTLGGPDRRRMQFTYGWQWRQIPGVDCRAPAAMAGARETTSAQLRAIRRATRCDVALGGFPPKEEKAFDPQWFTLADAACASGDRAVLLCRVSGEELIDIHQRWVSKEEITSVPQYGPTDIDPKRDYRVAMPLDLCGLLSSRGQNLRAVEAGPDLRAADVWAEIFGTK